jgi:hypothetical protein
MPISSVFSIDPVYAVTSSVPSVAGAGATAEVIAAAAGGVGGPTDVLVFSRAVFVAGVATYPVSVTLIGSVERKAAPAWRSSEGEKAELRPLTDTTFEITTDTDPAAALGVPAGTSMTNWLVEWAGFRLLVVGPAVPQGAGWLTKAVLTL